MNSRAVRHRVVYLSMFMFALVPSLSARVIAQTADPGVAAKSPINEYAGLNLALNLRAGFGFGAELSKLVFSHVGVRVGAMGLNYSTTQDLSNVSFDARLNLRNYTALVDLFPYSYGTFHFTTGYVGMKDVIQGSGVPTQDGTFEINGTEYTSAEVGKLGGRLAFPNSGLYAGIGWGSPVRHGSRFRLITDLGVVIGTPKITLAATGAASNPQLAADLASKQTEIQEDVDKYAKVLPFMSTGISIHF